MANHKSALKRVRSDKAKTLRNKYQHKTTRNAVRVLRATTDKKEAEKLYPSVVGMLDKLAKRNIIHKKKAANLKSGLALHIAKL
ncbi:MAG TPA: 30S ribosomal protein S20 [Brumimicrobium sp.]|nr:30S ribosomal protein S20 [Brumimicrobium sp.]